MTEIGQIYTFRFALSRISPVNSSHYLQKFLSQKVALASGIHIFQKPKWRTADDLLYTYYGDGLSTVITLPGEH